jgi:hypothetical protein
MIEELEAERFVMSEELEPLNTYFHPQKGHLSSENSN